MISIITINFNNEDGLRQTIQSVVSQQKIEFEYIVIDGASNDGSKAVIEQFEDRIDYWISEPDNGIYGAMNKGILASKGEYLLFLNSGDSLYSNSILSEVSERLSSDKDIYYGNLCLSSSPDERLLTYPTDLSFSFVYKNSLPHPASFIKRTLFGSTNLYNEKLKLVSDWQFFMVAIFKRNVSYEYLSFTVSNFDTGGFSNSPEFKSQMKTERDAVMKKEFPMFFDDIIELEAQRKILERNDVKMLLDLSKSKIGKRIQFKLMKILLMIFPKKDK